MFSSPLLPLPAGLEIAPIETVDDLLVVHVGSTKVKVSGPLCFCLAKRRHSRYTRVVSLEDGAWRRGHRYGTLIGDLERHRRLAVLPDRAVAQVAAWLKRCPSIAIMSRDRRDTYAPAAKLGAPQAIQVPDQWHLLKHLSAALPRCLCPHLPPSRKQQTKGQFEASPVLQIKRPLSLHCKSRVCSCIGQNGSFATSQRWHCGSTVESSSHC